MSIQFATSPVEILAWQRLVLAEPSLSHTASRIATRLSLYINSQSGWAWPSLRTLAQMSNTSYSSVKRAIKQLSTLRLVQVERGHAGRSNRYRAVLSPEATELAAGNAASGSSSDQAPSAVKPPELANDGDARVTRADGHDEGHRLGARTDTEADVEAAEADRCVDAEVAQVVEHLNRRGGGCFPSAPGTATYRILRRALHEHSPDALCAVVDLKAAQWGGTEQARYLRPSTLFAPSKLEAYLSEIHRRQEPAPGALAHRCVAPEPAPKRASPAVIQGHLDQIYRMLGGRSAPSTRAC